MSNRQNARRQVGHSTNDGVSNSSKTRRILDHTGGDVPIAEKYQWFPPVRWAAQLVQFTVVILILSIAKMFELMFQKQKKSKTRERGHARG